MRGFVATRGAAWLASDEQDAPQGAGNIGAALALRTSFTENAADSAGPAIFALRRHVISLVNSTIPDAGAGSSAPILVVTPPPSAAAAPVTAMRPGEGAVAPASAAGGGPPSIGTPSGSRRLLHWGTNTAEPALDVGAAQTQPPCPLATMVDADSTDASDWGVWCGGHRGHVDGQHVLRGLRQEAAGAVGGGGVPAVAVAVVSSAVEGVPGSEVYAQPPLAVLLDGLGEARIAEPFREQSSGITTEDDAWTGQLRLPSLEDEGFVALWMVPLRPAADTCIVVSHACMIAVSG